MKSSLDLGRNLVADQQAAWRGWAISSPSPRHLLALLCRAGCLLIQLERLIPGVQRLAIFSLEGMSTWVTMLEYTFLEKGCSLLDIQRWQESLATVTVLSIREYCNWKKTKPNLSSAFQGVAVLSVVWFKSRSLPVSKIGNCKRKKKKKRDSSPNKKQTSLKEWGYTMGEIIFFLMHWFWWAPHTCGMCWYWKWKLHLYHAVQFNMAQCDCRISTTGE